VGLMKIENLIRYTPRAVGLMEIEHLFRYTALAVGLKPSASQGEARLRGLWRNNYSKTISPHCRGSRPTTGTTADVFSYRPTCTAVAARGARW
jgi:hypothetical protein